MRSKKTLIVSIGMLLTSTALFATSSVGISNFAGKTLDGWEAKSFAGKTEYKLVDDNGRSALRAESTGTASGLGKKIKIDLEKTPWLNWSWKVEGNLTGLNERTKPGDDYIARLYVVKSGGALIWRTKALNYVWSGNQPKEEVWPNAFQPKNAIMLAVRGADDDTGVWVTEKRNVREDMKRAFGKDYKNIDAVALMTDTDNSGRSATAYYGEIYFTAD